MRARVARQMSPGFESSVGDEGAPGGETGGGQGRGLRVAEPPAARA